MSSRTGAGAVGVGEGKPRKGWYRKVIAQKVLHIRAWGDIDRALFSKSCFFVDMSKAYPDT